MAKPEQKKKGSSARRVLTPTARGSYLHIFKPTTFKKKTSYSATLLFPKKGTDMTPIIRARNAALKEQFGPDKEDWPKGLDNPIRDGDKPKFADKEGYKGHWVVRASASEEFKPGVFDKDGEEIVDAKGIVSGDYIRAQVYAIAWDVGEDSRGSSFLLDGIQLVKKGKPLSARGEMKFDPVAGDEDDDDDHDDMDDEEDEDNSDASDNEDDEDLDFG